MHHRLSMYIFYIFAALQASSVSGLWLQGGTALAWHGWSPCSSSQPTARAECFWAYCGEDMMGTFPMMISGCHLSRLSGPLTPLATYSDKLPTVLLTTTTTFSNLGSTVPLDAQQRLNASYMLGFPYCIIEMLLLKGMANSMDLPTGMCTKDQIRCEHQSYLHWNRNHGKFQNKGGQMRQLW